MSKWQKGWTCMARHPKYARRICGVKTTTENVSPCGHSWISFKPDIWWKKQDSSRHLENCTCGKCSRYKKAVKKKMKKSLEKINASIMARRTNKLND